MKYEDQFFLKFFFYLQLEIQISLGLIHYVFYHHKNLINAVGTDCHRIDNLYQLEDHLNLKHFHQLALQENLFNKQL